MKPRHGVLWEELVRKWEVGIGINGQVDRKSPLHGKRVSNNNLTTWLLGYLAAWQFGGKDNLFTWLLDYWAIWRKN